MNPEATAPEPSFLRSPLDRAPFDVRWVPSPLVRQEERVSRTHRSAKHTAARVIGLVLLVALVAVAAAAYPYYRYRTATDDLNGELAAMTKLYDSSRATVAEKGARIAALQGELANSQAEAAALREAKTIVQTKTVTVEVPKWVPSAEGVAVETTGFEGMVAIHDVQITHSYGFTDLIGIAVNKSGQTITYAELGCTFVGADGELLANGMVNKQNWAPGQSWGFTCSAQVDATGGIVRVNEMS
jgi:hypothetical protein